MYSASVSYLGFIFMTPFYCHHIISIPEICPAFDLIIIYYITTHYCIKNWVLFLIGLILDHLYHIPFGAHAILLIITNILINQIKKTFALQDFDTNIRIFCMFCLLCIVYRFMMVVTQSNDYTQKCSISFYYFTTILSYPMIGIFIKKPINVITHYDS